MIKLLCRPTSKLRYTSPFGPRWGTLHRGVDIGAEHNLVCGDNLYATADGIAQRVRPNEPSYGNYIIIEHNGWCDLYAHLQDFTVKTGQPVKAGDIIGHMGTTGDSQGAHLHYEIRNCFYIRVYDRGIVTTGGITFEDMPKYLIDPKPYIDAADAPDEDCADLVAKRCGLDNKVVAYINKYTFAKILWSELWKVIKNRRQMPDGHNGDLNKDLATAVARECKLEYITIKYIWGYADKQTVHMEIWKKLWWQMQ